MKDDLLIRVRFAAQKARELSTELDRLAERASSEPNLDLAGAIARLYEYAAMWDAAHRLSSLVKEAHTYADQARGKAVHAETKREMAKS